MIIGYARVSTDGQTLDAQHTTLRAAGAQRTFSEKVSGAKTNRVQLAKAIDALGAGDVLLVTRLDRLARAQGTCSMSLQQSLTKARALNRLLILGPIQQRRTVG